ncbi:hypothetical protein [Dyadobacter tibetensis]|uniref:hypothetical protein n=1 Tax=Dyadobacter tibetensis TaxID=1211851 RepID=UPI00103ECD28|nr:hypothetical protein [Dyadobacter tibetensis]
MKRINYLIMAALLVTGMCCENADLPSEDGEGGGGGWPQQTAYSPLSGQASINIGPNERYVNLMGQDQAPMPKFPKIGIKKGFVRGYVADITGKPLKGAYIGVRVTMVGGHYSGASGESDENGYYEIQLPYGTVEYYAAGYTIDYGSGKAVVGLHPADDNSSGFASENGMVKNFVLQSYGQANKDDVLQYPGYASTYYGGALTIDYFLDWNTGNDLQEGDVIVLELTPDGPGIFGDKKSFKIQKTAGAIRTTLVNIPVGKYTITAKLSDGRKLKMRESGPYANYYAHLGVKSTTPGTGSLLFVPSIRVTPAQAPPHRSNWDTIQLLLELP